MYFKASKKNLLDVAGRFILGFCYILPPQFVELGAYVFDVSKQAGVTNHWMKLDWVYVIMWVCMYV